jgi:hypothetical protein
MDNSFQTSFIPKKPINLSGKTVRPPTSIFTILSFLLLILIGLASGGLFLYKNYLTNQEQVLSSSLEKVRNTFEKDTIDELELYDKRVSASKKILGSHIVLSPMFELVGNLTIPSIQYTKFDHQTNAQGFSVKLSGIASDYKSIALQADVFNSAKGRSFKNVVFSNLARDKTNNVNFDLEFSVDPALLSYQKNMVLEQIQAKINSANPIEVQPPSDTLAPTAPTTIPATDLPPTGTLVPEPGVVTPGANTAQ